MIEALLCAFFGGALIGWACGTTIAKKDLPQNWNRGARAGFIAARCGRARAPHLVAYRSGDVTVDGLPVKEWSQEIERLKAGEVKP